MKAFSRGAVMPHKRAGVERRVLICEICGERLEIDPESGECRCPVCEMPEE